MDFNYTLSFSENNTLEENVKLAAQHYECTIKPVSGFFFKFKATPEYEKLLLEYLINIYGWKFDYNKTFIRKPE